MVAVYTEAFCIKKSLKMVRKERVNWTLDPGTLLLLQQAQKINPRKNISISQLVEFAVRQTFKNRTEMLREQMRQHQQEIMKLNDELAELENIKKEEECKAGQN